MSTRVRRGRDSNFASRGNQITSIKSNSPRYVGYVFLPACKLLDNVITIIPKAYPMSLSISPGKTLRLLEKK